MNHPEVTELPFGTPVEGKNEGCFLVLTARAKVYETYEHVPQETRDTPHRVVLMVARWDGCLGFPGGKREKGETLIEALRREALEEVNFDLGDLEPVPMCTHNLVNSKFVVHAMLIDLGDVEVSVLKDISRRAVDAQHYLSEGTAFWLHVADYGRGKGFPSAVNGLKPASAVHEELQALLQARPY